MKYSVKIKNQTFDCECCGCFSMSDCNIKIGNERFSLSHDGHFGGGVWNGDEDTVPIHVIGLIHKADRIIIEDINFSWHLFTSDDSLPPDNCSIEVLDSYYKNTTSIKLEIACHNGIYSFLIDDKLIFDHSVFLTLFVVSDLELYEKEGYMMQCDIWSIVCEHYIESLTID